MKLTAKVIALLLLVPAAFVAYAYASLYFAGYLFPRVLPRPYTEMVSAAAVGSLVAGIVVAFPLARLFTRRCWLAGLIVASPLVVVRVSDLVHYAGKNEPRIMVMSVVELLLYPAAIVACAWLVGRLLEAARVKQGKVLSGTENAA
jgi:hypothetical protein